MKRFYDIYQFVVPALLFPLAYWLWFGRVGSHAVAALIIFVPVVGSFMEPRILGGRQGTFIGTVIEDQFTAVFNWPLGAALSFLMLAFVLLVLALAAPALRRAAQ